MSSNKFINGVFNNPDLGSFFHRPAITVLDATSVVLPQRSLLSLDGVILNIGDRVLFTALTNARLNNRIYKVLKSRDSTFFSFELEKDGQDITGAPKIRDAVLVKQGSLEGNLFSFNGISWLLLELDFTESDDLKRDGSNSPSANINWNSKKITNLAAGTISTDAINLSQLTAVAAASLHLDGSNSPTSNISWNSKQITNITQLSSPANSNFIFNETTDDYAYEMQFRVGNSPRLVLGSDYLTVYKDILFIDGVNDIGNWTPGGIDLQRPNRIYVKTSANIGTKTGESGVTYLGAGGASIAGASSGTDLTFNGKLRAVTNPSLAQDAATKNYVDTHVNTVSQVFDEHTNVLYVDSNRIDVYTADGSLARPFKKIQDAIDAITSPSATNKHLIDIAPGAYYSDPITVDKIYTTFRSCGIQGARISGKITIATPSLSQITFVGLRISGGLECLVSHIAVNAVDCNVTGVAWIMNPTVPTDDEYLQVFSGLWFADANLTNIYTYLMGGGYYSTFTASGSGEFNINNADINEPFEAILSGTLVGSAFGNRAGNSKFTLNTGVNLHIDADTEGGSIITIAGGTLTRSTKSSNIVNDSTVIGTTVKDALNTLASAGSGQVFPPSNDLSMKNGATPYKFTGQVGSRFFDDGSKVIDIINDNGAVAFFEWNLKSETAPSTNQGSNLFKVWNASGGWTAIGSPSSGIGSSISNNFGVNFVLSPVNFQFSQGINPQVDNSISIGSTALGKRWAEGHFAGQVRMGSLSVANSAAATISGSIVKKMEVFDASGVSLGFVAIFDSIT